MYSITFLDILLVFLICFVIITLIKHNKNKKHRHNKEQLVVTNNSLSNPQLKSELNNIVGYSNNECYSNPSYNDNKNKNIKKCSKLNNKHFNHFKNKKQDLVEFTNGKTHLGPVQNFHQCFNKNFNLGWRKFYLNNFNENNLNEQDNGLEPLNNYLNSMGNVQNLYLN